METISISTLKTHLSATLKQVLIGVRYIVLDREHPVAELIPYSEQTKLTIRNPKNSSKQVKNYYKGNLKLDPVDYLLEDRDGG